MRAPRHHVDKFSTRHESTPQSSLLYLADVFKKECKRYDSSISPAIFLYNPTREKRAQEYFIYKVVTRKIRGRIRVYSKDTERRIFFLMDIFSRSHPEALKPKRFTVAIRSKRSLARKSRNKITFKLFSNWTDQSEQKVFTINNESPLNITGDQFVERHDEVVYYLHM